MDNGPGAGSGAAHDPRRRTATGPLWHNLAAQIADLRQTGEIPRRCRPFDVGVGHADLRALAPGRQERGALGQRSLFRAKTVTGGDHHLHRFQLEVLSVTCQPPAPLRGPSPRTCWWCGSMRLLMDKNGNHVKPSRCRPAPAREVLAEAVLPPRHRRSDRGGRRRNTKVRTRADALHHRAVHAARRRRPAARGARGLHQSGPDGPVRPGDPQRYAIFHHGKLDVRTARRGGLHAARAAKQVPDTEPDPIRHPQPDQGGSRAAQPTSPSRASELLRRVLGKTYSPTSCRRCRTPNAAGPASWKRRCPGWSARAAAR